MLHLQMKKTVTKRGAQNRLSAKSIADDASEQDYSYSTAMLKMSA